MQKDAMNLFSEKHEMFRQTVKRFVREEIVPHAQEWDEKEYFAKEETLSTLAELGCTGITFPEKYGGMNEDWIMSLVFTEEISYASIGGWTLSITASTDMGQPHFYNWTTEEQRQKYLVPLIKGEAICAPWATEPGGGTDLSAITTHASKKNGYWVVNGIKQFASNSVNGDYGTILVRTNPDPKVEHKGFSMFMVELRWPGIHVVPMKKMFWRTADTGTIYLEDVKVPAENLLGEEGRGFYQQLVGYERERLSLAVSAVCQADHAVQLASAYAKERKAFGRPISQFQAIQHKLVDLATIVEAARQLTYKAAAMFVVGEEGKQSAETRRMIYMAKAFACDQAIHVVAETLHIFGSYYITSDMAISRIYRDVVPWSTGGGTTEAQKNVTAQLMGFGKSY